MVRIQYPLLFTVHVRIVYLFQLSLAPLQTFKQTFFTAWYVLGPFNSCLAWLLCCWKLGLLQQTLMTHSKHLPRHEAKERPLCIRHFILPSPSFFIGFGLTLVSFHRCRWYTRHNFAIVHKQECSKKTYLFCRGVYELLSSWRKRPI